MAAKFVLTERDRELLAWVAAYFRVWIGGVEDPNIVSLAAKFRRSDSMRFFNRLKVLRQEGYISEQRVAIASIFGGGIARPLTEKGEAARLSFEDAYTLLHPQK